MSAFFLKHPKETDLALFAGGESGPFARWRIERHVENCPQCQQIAADFFRLPDQLNGLADLPSVDWKQMAMVIESGVRADAAMGRRARRSELLPSLAWQAGLVAATVVAAVIVVRQADQPEPQLVATAKIEAAAPAPQGDEERQETVAAEAPRTVVAPAAPQSEAVETRQTLASDVAAPTAPPPPPAALNEAVLFKQASGAAQPVAAEAESAEVRLRNDAAARVGAVSALSAAPDQAAGSRQARIAWAQWAVEAVNLEGAPATLSSGHTALAGAIAKTPTVAATNRTERAISGFELLWIVGDASGSATALIRREGISLAPGAVATTGGDRSWRLPAGITSAAMRIYLSAVSFDDGTTWSAAPSALPIGTAELQLLPVVIERDDRP